MASLFAYIWVVRREKMQVNTPYPNGSMYGVFTYGWLMFVVHVVVVKYTIPGCYCYGYDFI